MRDHNRDLPQRPQPRRAVLGTIGTLAATLAGCTTSAPPDDGNNKGQDSVAAAHDGDAKSDEKGADEPAERDEDESGTEGPENGALVVVYDDGPIEDVEEALPVHEEFDVPATAGIVSEWVGRSSYMGTDELDRLVDAGWEIASHTREHTTVGAFRLVHEVLPDDRRVKAEGYRHGHHEGKTVEISNGRVSTRHTVTGLAGEPGDRWIEFEEPVGRHYRPGESEIRYPPEEMRDMLQGSKADLEEMGYEVETLLAPYDIYTGWSDLFVPDVYEGVANATHGSRVNSLDGGGFDPYSTRRDYFAEFSSEESVLRDLDTIAEEGALGVVGGHTHKEEVTPADIRSFLSAVEERGIEVVTLREAIERYGSA